MMLRQKTVLTLGMLGTVLFCLPAFCQPDAPNTAKRTVIAPSAVVPAPRQLRYQQQEMIGFVHFTINTFTDKEWGDGTESPQLFNPVALDANQWAQTFKAAGLKTLILTAKHHDGFCLWPSQYTEHSVKNSPWKNGKGDVVKEVAEACRQAGIRFGIYLSPWDRHEPSYGTDAYNPYYLNQLRELLTNYGPVAEVWMDGAKGENAKNMEYDFDAWRQLIRELQPEAVIFSDAGPDVRWIGNEKGFAGETCWSTLDRSKVTIGKAGQEHYLNTGDPNGPDWVPGECDVSIRPGWFYHAAEDSRVKSLSELMDIYYQSVGRNGTLLLNIPPDRRGLLHETDVARLKAFKAVIDQTFQRNLAAGKKITVLGAKNKGDAAQMANLLDGKPETVWSAAEDAKKATVIIDLGQPATFDRALIAEAIQYGQRITAFRVEAQVNGQWQELGKGTTIGYKRLLRFTPVTASHIRLTIEKARETPVLSEFGLYKAAEQ